MKEAIIICLLAVCAFAAPDSLYSQAQKFYSQGNFEAAAKSMQALARSLRRQKKKEFAYTTRPEL